MLSVLLLGIVRIASTAAMITYFLSEYVSSTSSAALHKQVACNILCRTAAERKF